MAGHRNLASPDNEPRDLAGGTFSSPRGQTASGNRIRHKEVAMAKPRDEMQGKDLPRTPDRGLAEQDHIVTEDGEIIPRPARPSTQGHVIFEEPSLG
jgi:hypothetical protein